MPLDLALAFAQTYDRGRYTRVLRYTGPAPAALAAADRTWAAEQVVAGKR